MKEAIEPMDTVNLDELETATLAATLAATSAATSAAINRLGGA